MITITLNNKRQAEFLLQTLLETQDRGPTGVGWASNELIELREIVEKEIQSGDKDQDDQFRELINQRVSTVMDRFGLRWEGTAENGYIGSAMLQGVLERMVEGLCVEYIGTKGTRSNGTPSAT